MILTYRYRLLPSRKQHAFLAETLEAQRQLYNAALEERIGCYRATGKGRSYVDQCAALTEWRKADPTAAVVPVKLQRWTLSRLDDAYQAFYRRVKARSGRAGFPRFRGAGRWHSFGFNEFSGIRFYGKRLRWRGMPGGVRIHLHRVLPENADLRSCVFRRTGRGWNVCLQIAVETPEKHPVSSSVGIDLGLKVFGYQSDGIIIQPLHASRRVEREMRRRQRALARCKRGSNRRKKQQARVASLHQKTVNTRATWLHQHSARLAKSYDLIAAEDLNISGMIRNATLARSIADASWSKFLAMIAYKAERAGGHFITVNPRNTSQKCSGCGVLVPKSLAVRTHSCPSCGLVIDRDWNAARNVLAAIVSGRVENVAHRSVRRPGNISFKTETLS